MGSSTEPRATGGLQIVITDKAADEVRRFMAEDEPAPVDGGLRISVLPGGCSGFKYDLKLEDEILEDDLVFEVNGVRVVVDGFSAPYLNGVTIDYVSSMQGSGFSFTNPNSSGGCGCGSSFTA